MDSLAKGGLFFFVNFDSFRGGGLVTLSKVLFKKL